VESRRDEPARAASEHGEVLDFRRATEPAGPPADTASAPVDCRRIVMSHSRRLPQRAVLLLACLAGPAGALAAQGQPRARAPATAPLPNEGPEAPRFLTQSAAVDKAPRTAGDWVVFTRDEDPDRSPGTVIALDLAGSREYELGAGFLPDVDVYPAAAGGGEGVPPPGAAGALVARVAWLRLHPDGRLSLESAIFDGEAWVSAELVATLGCADRPRVCGNYTAWTDSDAAGALRVQLHDGRQLSQPSAAGAPAFRPDLARSESGGFALVWDEYRGATGALNYEVCGRFREPGEDWSETVELSAAPESLDFVPSVAPAADGGWWIAWESDRGALLPRVVVAHRARDGSLAMTRGFPASSDPGLLGVVGPPRGGPAMRPVLQTDAGGRLWLVFENKVLGSFASVFDKRLMACAYDGGAWSEPALLPGGPLGEKSADATLAGGRVRVVYQDNASPARSLDVALAELGGGEPAAAPVLEPRAGPTAPALPHPRLRLPAERALDVDGVGYRLVFADLHSHTGQSPDGLGERDHALFWARDIMHLDAWASTDHDVAQHEPLLDWEYELARRFVDHFDAPGFTTFMGFEWSNHEKSFEGEVIGHRATFSSRRCYRYTDPAFDELSEYYAAMEQEDAIGVPHHLGKFGGATFKLFDARVQPVTEVSSGHGVFEDLLLSKLLGDRVRFGVTCAGDDHLSMPGYKGLAGIFIDPRLPSRREAIKQALRERRCFGAVRHGLYADLRLDGRPMGAALTHAGDLLARVAVSEVWVGNVGPAPPPSDEEEPGADGPAPESPGAAPPREVAQPPVHVTIAVDGDYAHPVYSRTLQPGDRLDDLAVLPGRPDDAFYMLRVTSGAQGVAPKDTVLWSSPIWVDAERDDGYPRPSISPPPGAIAPGEPVTLSLGLGGPGELAEAALHVGHDGAFVGTVPLSQLVAAVSPGGASGGEPLSLPLGALPPGTWLFVLACRDRQGHDAVAATTLSVAR